MFSKSSNSHIWIICKAKSTLEYLHLKIILRISGIPWFSHILPLLQRKAMQSSSQKKKKKKKKKLTRKATHTLCSETASAGNTLYPMDVVLATGRGSGIHQRHGLVPGAQPCPWMPLILRDSWASFEESMTRLACKERRQAFSKRRTRNASAASCRTTRAWIYQLKSTPRVNLTRISLAGEGVGIGGGLERKRRLKRR